ncbi:MAG: hypothetical protein ACYC2K_16760 [Gemmatimonadales bacterium]
MEFLDQLAAPWARLYAESTAVSNAVVLLHLTGILWGGGRAVTADVMILRSAGLDRFREQQGTEFLAASHRQVLAGLAAIVFSGALMVLADRAHYFGTTLYWVKMGVVALLVVNGATLTRLHRTLTGDALSRSNWGRVRLHSAASLLLWFVILGLGVWLGS